MMGRDLPSTFNTLPMMIRELQDTLPTPCMMVILRAATLAGTDGYKAAEHLRTTEWLENVGRSSPDT